MKVCFAEFRNGKLYDVASGQVVKNLDMVVFMNPYVVYFMKEGNETKQDEMNAITEWLSDRYSASLSIMNVCAVVEKLSKPKEHCVWIVN